jgi:hypothetical protein
MRLSQVWLTPMMYQGQLSWISGGQALSLLPAMEGAPGPCILVKVTEVTRSSDSSHCSTEFSRTRSYRLSAVSSSVYTRRLNRCPVSSRPARR